MTDQNALVKAAIEALETANVPDNVPKFGAAVLTANKHIYAGAQYRAETSQLSLHAEQVAVAHAAAHGEYDILAIAVVSTEDELKDDLCHLCGVCKQLIYDLSLVNKHDIDVLMANRKGTFLLKKISELCPYPWPAPR